MLIQNIFSTNNYNNNSLNNTHLKKTNPYFTGNITKEIQLTQKELQQVSVISEWYDKISKIFTSLSSGLYQNKFKSLYPNLVSGEKIKGFVFNSFKELKNKNLQIVKFNTKENSDELLTFSILDKNNKNLLRYRINKLGKAIISADEENLSQLSINPFQKNTTIDYDKFLTSFQKEVENLGFYSENFKDIHRKTFGRASVDFTQAFSEVKSLQKSFGINIKDISNITNNYASLNQVINANNGKDALALKQAYFNDISAKTKGLIFKNLLGDKTVAYCPLQSKDDNRVFKITIHNSNNELENAFVIFADGRIAKQKILSAETNAFRPNNLTYISDEEINNFEIPKIFTALNDEFEKFKTFIIDTRNSKIQNKIEAKETKQKEKRQAQKLEKQEKQELKRQEKEKIKSEKEAQKQEQLKIKQEIKELKEQQKNAKIEQKRLAIEEKQKQATLKAQAKAIKIAQKIMKQEEIQLNKFIKKLAKIKKQQAILEVPNISKRTNTTRYRNLLLKNLSKSLNELFNLPIEQRSPHLIHEKLPNGNIFVGRCSFKASDGAYITVSRIKSPKYVDFTYYSIKAEKDGKELIFNLDPETSKIINSKNGKPIINKQAIISYISKDDYLQQNPDAINLPMYIKELFNNKPSAKRKIIDLKPTLQQNILTEKEKAIQKALNDIEDLDEI